MKKYLFITSILFLMSCSDDTDSKVIDFDDTNPETVLKLKAETNRYITTYYYNEAGFVDSLAQISNYGGNPEHYFKKFIYQNDSILEIKTYVQERDSSNAPDLFSKEIFEYSESNISKILIYNNVDVITGTVLYTYENNGSIVYESNSSAPYIFKKTYTKNNLTNIIGLKNQTEELKYNYTFDNKFNPKYFIYPVAYSKILGISKNNILTNGFESSTYNQMTNYILEYNNNNFLTSYTIQGKEGSAGNGTDYYTYY